MVVQPALTTDMLVVFGMVGVVVVLFVGEIIPPDTTAIAVVVSLVVLGEWTQVGAAEALSGFSNPATLTIVAMYVLSAGVQGTGAIHRLGASVARYTHGRPKRLLGATVGITGPLAGVVNNTPVVAMFIPMVTELADETHVSPSKLLIPLSYAAMLGGTLTLVGTATNVLASDLAVQLSDEYPSLHAISMFEFTPVGVLVLAVGALYLLTVAQRLLPERIEPVDLTAEFGLEGHLARVYVRQSSPLVGKQIREAVPEEYDLDILQIVRGDRAYLATSTDQEIRHQDVLTVRATTDVVERFVEELSLRRLPRARVTEDELDLRNGQGTIAEIVVAPDSSLDGETIESRKFRERYRATVLAVRKGDTLIHEDLPDVTLTEGTSLLLHLSVSDVEHLVDTGDVILSELAPGGDSLEELAAGFEPRRGLLATGIVAGVIALAAVDVLPIAIAALGGMVAMVVTGIIRPSEAYDAVNWEVIFLLAGVYPLGIAIGRTGGAEFLGALIASAGADLPAIVVLGMFYLLTGLLANVITPIASLVLLVPVAVDTAARIGSPEISFLFAVAFGATTAFMTPVGYQTNLMVYSPGGYRFTDYVRVGAPLQAILTVVTTLGIAFWWGI